MPGSSTSRLLGGKISISFLICFAGFGIRLSSQTTTSIQPNHALYVIADPLSITSCENSGPVSYSAAPNVAYIPAIPPTTIPSISTVADVDVSSQCDKNQYICNSIEPTRHYDPFRSSTIENCDDVASSIDNFRLNHIHTANEYVVGKGALSCSSCASLPNEGTQLHEIAIQRIHRYRDVPVIKASFGPGVFMNYDMSLTFFGLEDGSIVADLFDPLDFYARRFRDGFEDDSLDGIFKDPQTNIYEDLQLLDSNGNLTADISSVNTSVLKAWNGFTYTFEVFSLDTLGYMHAGRLVRIGDRIGYGIDLAYKVWSDAELAEAPDRQWQLDSIVDPYGRVAKVEYSNVQVSGHWVIKRINLPNGEQVDYTYSNGKISSVLHPDNTVSSFAYSYDPVSQKLVVDYQDASALGTHRNKKAYISNNFQGSGDLYINSSAGLIRMVTSNNEIFYLSTDVYRYSGTRRLKVRKGNTYYYSPSWEFDTVAASFTNVAEEPTFYKHAFTTPVDVTRGTPLAMTDNRGYTTSFEYDSCSFPVKQTFSDGPNGTTSGGTYEEMGYNVYHQLIRYRDRLGRVTLNSYDSLGNLLSTEVGIVDTTPSRGAPESGSNDIVIPSDYGQYTFEYYPPGHQNEYLMSAAVDANGNKTEYFYSAKHLLIKIIEPPDTMGGARAEQVFTFDNVGRLITTTDPVGRTTEFFYDERDRTTKTLYADGSTERYIYYGAGLKANMLHKYTDRNGSVTEFEYDNRGRYTKEIMAASTMDLNDNETPILDPNVRVESTCSYLDGTDQMISRIDQGERTDFTFDHRHRLIEITVYPRVGVSLTSKETYVDNQIVVSEDFYGRKEYAVYRDSDGFLVRTVSGMVPEFSTDQPYILERDLTPNAPYLITDFEVDAERQILKSTDPRGIEHSSSYDSRGRIIQSAIASSSPILAKTNMVYDPNGNVTQIQWPRTFSETGDFYTELTYTGRNLIESITQAVGKPSESTEAIRYNLDETIRSTLDARNFLWTTKWYTCCARAQAVVDPTGAGTVSNTDFIGNITHEATVSLITGQNLNSLTEVRNESTTRYDARHRPSESTDWHVPPGSIDRTNPPIAGDVGYPVASGITSQLLYDENLTDNIGLDASANNPSINKLLTELASDGIMFGSGSDGYATSMVNPEGEVFVQVYDGIGREVMNGWIDPVTNDPITWKTTMYDTLINLGSPGSLLQTILIDALDHKFSNGTDAMQRALLSLDEKGEITRYSYDANSNLIAIRDPNNVGQNCVYDQRDRQILCVDTHNDSTAYSFDDHDNLVTETDAKGASISYVFDAKDRLVSTTDRINGVTTLEYDDNDNQTKIIDSENKSTSYIFDSRNFNTKIIYPDLEEVDFEYDEAWRLARKQDQLDDFVLYKYDMLDRLVQRDYFDSSKTAQDPPDDSDVLSYDDALRLTAASKGRYSNTCTYTYDDAGRMVADSFSIYGQSFISNYTYDADNRNITIDYPDGSRVERTFTDRNQLENITYDENVLGQASPNSLLQVMSFEYDAGLRETTADYGNGLKRRKLYTRRDDLLTGIVVNGKPGLSLSYSYDENKNAMSENMGGVMAPYGSSVPESGGYDPEERINQWSRKNGDTASWSLSLVGDWNSFHLNGTDQSRVHNDVHEVISMDVEPLTYDNKGNQNQDHRGRALTLDFDNQLVSVDSSGQLVSFTYDAIGRRVGKLIETDTTVYVYSDDQVVAEYSNNNSGSLSPDRKYVYGRYLDEVLLMLSDTGNGEEPFYYHYNRRNSVIGVTDDMGDVAERYHFTPYGRTAILAPDGLTKRSLSTIGNPYLFTGRRMDGETGLYYFRARFYDPEQGRFLSRDPSGYADGMGMYEYVAGNPLNYSDPTGMKFIIDRKPILTINESSQKKFNEAKVKFLKQFSGKEYTTDDRSVATEIFNIMGNSLTPYKYSRMELKMMVDLRLAIRKAALRLQELKYSFASVTNGQTRVNGKWYSTACHIQCPANTYLKLDKVKRKAKGKKWRGATRLGRQGRRVPIPGRGRWVPAMVHYYYQFYTAKGTNKPSTAIAAIFSGTRAKKGIPGLAFDCATAQVLVYHYALLTVLKARKYDALVGNLNWGGKQMLGGFQVFGRYYLQSSFGKDSSGKRSLGDLIPGDIRHRKGENMTYLGLGQYYNHNNGIITHTRFGSRELKGHYKFSSRTIKKCCK